MHTQQLILLAGVLPTAVSVWHLASLQHLLVGFHGSHDLQAPREVQGAYLDFLTFFLDFITASPTPAARHVMFD